MRDTVSATVRRAVPADVERIAEIHEAAWAQALPEVRPLCDGAALRRHCAMQVAPPRDDRSLWVAARGGDVVGYMLRWRHFVDDLYVVPRAHRQGIGSALMRQAKREAGPDGLAVWCFAANLCARAFYEAHGFREAGRHDGYGLHLPALHYHWTP